jgi:predicted Zn-dependent protease
MTDDELAFIIGHEYAHIEQEHISKQNAANAAKREAFDFASLNWPTSMV